MTMPYVQDIAFVCNRKEGNKERENMLKKEREKRKIESNT